MLYWMANERFAHAWSCWTHKSGKSECCCLPLWDWGGCCRVDYLSALPTLEPSGNGDGGVSPTGVLPQFGRCWQEGLGLHYTTLFLVFVFVFVLVFVCLFVLARRNRLFLTFILSAVSCPWFMGATRKLRKLSSVLFLKPPNTLQSLSCSPESEFFYVFCCLMSRVF